MFKVLSYNELTNIMGTGNLEQFQDDVLINNIKVIYPQSKDITLHGTPNGCLMAMILM